MVLRPFALQLTPHGRVHVDPAPPEESLLDGPVADRLAAAFGRGDSAGLFELAALDPGAAVPASVAFFRDLTQLFLTRLCAQPEVESRREQLDIPADEPELAQLARRAPAMVGDEYVSTATLDGLWGELAEAYRAEIAAFDGPVERWLHAKNPIWNVVGRVCFHLAESRNDEARPFAFLATYATSVSSAGRVQHRPLGHALQEYAGAGRKPELLALLLPVRRAAEKSEFVKALVDSGRIFQPQALTVGEAHRFLRAIAECEAAGVVVRVPDWWKPKAPHRVGVQVTVGRGTPSKVGVAALVDFSVGLAVDGEPLSAEEWAQLRSQSAGLVRLRGKWVEIDPERLEQLLAHWEKAKKAHREGIPFHESMRLLAGVRLEGDGADIPLAGEAVRVVAGPWLEETLRALRGSDGGAGTHPGRALRATLRPYQEQGVHWLWYLNQLNLGGCLADDMGLGKTIQVLALLLLLKQRSGKRPHLLVVPTTLLANWQAEAARFAPELTFFVAHPSATPAAQLARGMPEAAGAADVVMTTYGSLHRWDWLRETGWDTVVLDEAQAIKNAGARQAKAAKSIRSRVRLALAGTPVENRIGDLWSLFDFLDPGLLGSAKELSRFLKGSQERGDGGTAALRALVRPYLLRRLKTDRRVITDLPDKTEVRAFCSLTKAQAALYQEVVDALAEQLRKKDRSDIGRKGVVLATLMKLKQICNHPSHFASDGGWQADRSGKFDRVRDIVEPLAARQEKALFFTQFREVTEPLAGYLQSLFGRPGLVLHGETPVKTRRERVERFQTDEDVPFMVLTVKAGGTGLNLTAASHVVHFDRWWNPAVENQATDRAFRIGQKKNVLVHKLVCRGTVEERIDEMIEGKKQLAADLIEDRGGETLLTELDDRELLRVVALDVNRAVVNA